MNHARPSIQEMRRRVDCYLDELEQGPNEGCIDWSDEEVYRFYEEKLGDMTEEEIADWGMEAS